MKANTHRKIKNYSNIFHYLRKIILTILHKRDIWLVKLTEKHEIENLLNRLRPVDSGMELIRLGPKGDGGYLVPDDLLGIKACFSPGVDISSGFEKDCADIGMNVFLADKSVDEPAETHQSFHFIKKFIGVTTNKSFITLDDWVASTGTKSDEELLLQIDIEGSEYEVFLSASDELLKRFRIIVVEFHALHQLWNQPLFRLSSRVFDKLLQTHTVVHSHPNNYKRSIRIDDIEIPKMMEFTFLRNDRMKTVSFVNDFPHPLDCNNTNNSPLHLPECWYK